MTISLIFLDLDGTLIGANGHVSPAIWQAVSDVQAAGIELAVCTGRTGQGVAREIAERLSPNSLHIFDSGAVVTRLNGQALMTQGLAPDSLRRLAEVARAIAPESMIEFYTADGIFAEHLSWRCVRHARVLGQEITERSLDAVIKSHTVIRAHWIVAPKDLDRALELALPECQISVASSPALPESMFASITRRGVSKGSAARLVAAELGVDLANTMAVGDSTGDLPVLEIVGHPRVMGESPEELRARFKTLGGIDEDGVVAALREAIVAR